MKTLFNPKATNKGKWKLLIFQQDLASWHFAKPTVLYLSDEFSSAAKRSALSQDLCSIENVWRMMV